MILSDTDILMAIKTQRIVVDPFIESAVQPASVDLHLDKLFRSISDGHIDPKRETVTDLQEVNESIVLVAETLLLGATIERIRLPRNLAARVDGKSSLARLGLLVHITAGFIDPGFEGHITLELVNPTNKPIILYPGMPVAQISFMELSSPAKNAYGSDGLRSKYQYQPRGPAPSRFHRNFS